MSTHTATHIPDVRVEVHTHRHRYKPHGLLFKSPWWLLLAVGVPVGLLIWLTVVAYYAGQAAATVLA